MERIRILPVGNDFIIKNGKQDWYLNPNDEFSQFPSDAIRFPSELLAWRHLIRKKFIFETKIVGSFRVSFNFERRLESLFWDLKNGKAIKSVTCYAGETNKNNREKDFTITDFYAEYYCVAMVSISDNTKYADLVKAYKGMGAEAEKETQFYMNWVIDFELY